MVLDLEPGKEIAMVVKHQVAICFATVVAVLSVTACSLGAVTPTPSAVPTAGPSPTPVPPTNTPEGIPGLDMPMPFGEGKIQIVIARLMDDTGQAGDLPYPIPPNYKAADPNDIILVVIAVPSGGDPSTLAQEWKDLDVVFVDENGRESRPDIQGSGESNGKWFVMWITAVSKAAKEFALYLTPEVKLDITILLSQ